MTSPEPSPNELELLKALWRGGRASAREVHEAAGAPLGWSYSTTRTVLSRMVEKGLVTRGEFHGLTLFEAKPKKVEMIGRMVRDFARRVLEVEGHIPASAFTDSPLLDEAEREELRALLEETDAQEKSR
ncbi:BlaI/MecI/CopY family transcriptional regulator [Marinicauda algicola]|uniref:BlaI/MecI/CopY family transcriptional regulator n=1 Tax=Marinicauda algicola TaxID=2029849 RepID=A0A4S2GZ07_9PROT|nr:BlaI/MecI/CopY family transcriptional regulator [Marinicauda algicola]TGY88344.1 BlaI/MecI/CopY family transcriptional regulator [Marinicauda algicola]